MQTITCRIGPVVHHGRAVSLARPVDPAIVVEAIHEGAVELPERKVRLHVDAPAPHPVHDHVGSLHPEMGIRTRTALARAGRSRGASTPFDGQLREARAELAELERPRDDDRSHRRTVAETDSETARLVEQIATKRGRLRERLESDASDASRTVGEQLTETIRELSEIETERAAARERLERERARRRVRRQHLERRRELQDRIANLEREARRHLVDRFREPFCAAVARVPPATTDDGAAPGHGDPPDPFDTDPVTAALAIARVGNPGAPVVLACNRFESPAAASEWLGVPVIDVSTDFAGSGRPPK